MRIALTIWLIFLIALATHVLIWKLFSPQYKYHMKALLLIFGAVFCLWFITPAFSSTSLPEFLNIALSYFALSLGYMVAYSAVNVDSPTLSLIRFLAEKRVEGRDASEVNYFLAQRPFVKARLKTLIDAGLIREDHGRWIIAGRTSLPFRFILAYRKLYGPISKGG